MHHTQPVRGVVRLDDLVWDPAALAAEVARFPEADWQVLSYGTAWKQIMIVHPEAGGGQFRHPILATCPTIQAVFDAFPGRLLDASLASIAPGGAIGEHRDISGGTPMGVARFHVPIVTDPQVAFFVSGQRQYLAPGETWNLDTTYPHAVRNDSKLVRVHLIVDIESNDAVAAMLPRRDLRDRLHQVHFAAICAQKGVVLGLKDPRALVTRARKFVKLLVFRQSVLRPED